jgi:hypothetical protein
MPEQLFFNWGQTLGQISILKDFKIEVWKEICLARQIRYAGPGHALPIPCFTPD